MSFQEHIYEEQKNYYAQKKEKELKYWPDVSIHFMRDLKKDPQDLEQQLDRHTKFTMEGGHKLIMEFLSSKFPVN